MWDLSGRAKWDSWKTTGAEPAYSAADGASQAAKAYEDEASKLGWPGLDAKETEMGEDEVRGVQGRHRAGKEGNEGAGMVHVSQMEREELDDDA